MLYYSPSLFIENCKIHFIINQVIATYVHVDMYICTTYVHVVDVKYKKYIAVIGFSEGENYCIPSVA